MGAIEEGEKVASTLIDALKTQPLALALVVINLCFLIAGVYFLHDLSIVAGAGNVRKDALVIELLTNQKAAMELLSRCVVPK